MVVVDTPRLVGIWQLFVLSQLHGPAAQTPVGSGQVLQGCANFNLDRNRNMPDHGLRPKASRKQEPADSRVHFPLAVPAQQREIVLSRSQDQILAASGSRRMEVIRSYLAAAIRNGTSLCGVPLGRCRQ